MWPTRAYSFRLVAIMGTTKISPHRSPWRLGGHRPRHLAKPFVGRSGFASGRGSRPARSPLGPNLRHEAASLQNLEHVRGERIETVDATVREMDLTLRHVDLDHVPGVDLPPQSCTLEHRESQIDRVPEQLTSCRWPEWTNPAIHLPRNGVTPFAGP